MKSLLHVVRRTARTIGGILRQRYAEHDKHQHVRWSFGLTLGAALILPLSWAVALVFAIGIGKECWDQRYGSGFCFWDIGANILGIAAAILLIRLISTLWV
jgi:hypothetical protein